MDYSLPFNVIHIPFPWQFWIMFKINSASLLYSESLLFSQHWFEIIQARMIYNIKFINVSNLWWAPYLPYIYNHCFLLVPKSLKRSDLLFNSLLPLILVIFSHNYPVCSTLSQSAYTLNCFSLLTIGNLSISWTLNTINCKATMTSKLLEVGWAFIHGTA